MAAEKFALRVLLIVSRTEANDRVSTVQICDARPLVPTSNFQRGCVSHAISAFGNVARKAATAGNVWTMSPSEPRRTTKKRGSVMRRLADRFEQFASGVILGVANDGDADSEARRNIALGDSIRRIVSAFGMDIGTQILKEPFDVGLSE